MWAEGSPSGTGNEGDIVESLEAVMKPLKVASFLLSLGTGKSNQHRLNCSS